MSRKKLIASLVVETTSWLGLMGLLLFLLMFVPIWCGWLVLMALDAQRWRTSNVPPFLNIAGAGLVIVGFLATVVVLRENSFAAPVVRVQARQRVIATGPYALVRHPSGTCPAMRTT
jgi:protein-S-isoprenylcysteine O-methyltransferase Ste14